MARLLPYRRVKHAKPARMKVLAEDLPRVSWLERLSPARFTAFLAALCATAMAVVFIAADPDRRGMVGAWSSAVLAGIGQAIASAREGCHPSYFPCLQTGRDVDCADRIGPVLVIGPDDYRLDGDGDRIGCE